MKNRQKKKSVHWQVSTLFSKADDEKISSPQSYQKSGHFVKRKGGNRIG